MFEFNTIYNCHLFYRQDNKGATGADMARRVHRGEPRERMDGHQPHIAMGETDLVEAHEERACTTCLGSILGSHGS